MKSLIDRTRLPTANWNRICLLYRKARSFEDIPMLEKNFDVPGFYVGSTALDTYAPYLVKISTTCEASQLMTIELSASLRHKRKDWE